MGGAYLWSYQGIWLPGLERCARSIGARRTVFTKKLHKSMDVMYMHGVF